MSIELTNLLPSERRHTLARDYLLRLATLSLGALVLLIAVHGVLLLSAYAYVHEQQGVQEKRLTALSEQRADSGFNDLSARIALFTERATALQLVQKAPTASEALRAVGEVSRRGITLSSFAFTAGQKGTPGRMTVAGTASTRESLRSFDAALGALPSVKTTDLPLSSYAKESAIPFSIVLTFNEPAS